MSSQTISCPSCGHQNPDTSNYCTACGGKLEKKTDPLIGRTVNNRFRVEKRIASGVLSIHYLATHLKSGKQVLLKVFKQQVVKNTSLFTTLKENSARLKALSHANIARIYDIGPVGNSCYIARQYVSGVTLEDLIAKKGTLSHKAACTIAAQMASGLEAAHNAGIIHGAMKPANIIIDKDGRVFLTDLGCAGIEAEADIPGRTAEYLSPEQAAGETYDGRADIYSVGIILYELLTGHSPFRSNSWDTTVSYILNRKPTPIEQIRPDLPAAVVSFIRRATSRDRLQRFRSMQDMVTALNDAAKAPIRKVGPSRTAAASESATAPMTATDTIIPSTTVMSSPADTVPASTVITPSNSGSYSTGTPTPALISKIPAWLILSITVFIIFLLGYGSTKMCSGPAVPLDAPGPLKEEGTLSGTGDSSEFTIDAGFDEYVEVYFTWPRGLADIWVEVVGEDGYTVLGDFDLDDGEIIQLMGGGVFYLTVYSKDGAATWSAEYSLGDDPYYDPFSGYESPFDDYGDYGTTPPADSGLHTEGGYLTGTGDSFDFVVNAGFDEYVEVYFTWPRGSADIWVKVVGEDGHTVLGDFDLDSGEIIQLMGGGTFYVTVYSKSNDATWSAEYSIGDDSSYDPYSEYETPFDVYGGPDIMTPTEPVTYTESGTLIGSGESYGFTVNAGTDDFVEVYFTWPRGQSDFWVEVVGEDGYTVLGNFDLDDGEIIQLMGGRTFYLTIYSKMGGGAWSAEYVIDE
ncbi:MAG: protein kinase [Deltaproteobacteria bacterium]|nr:protein kinase [Candidatus Zymogenaceae bacterium]